MNGCSGVLLQFPSAHEVSRPLIGHAHYASIVVATFPVGHAKRHESTDPEKDTVAIHNSCLNAVEDECNFLNPKISRPRTGEL